MLQPKMESDLHVKHVPLYLSCL